MSILPLNLPDPEKPEPLEFDNPHALVRYFKGQTHAAKSNELYLKQVAFETEDPQWIQAAIEASDIAIQWEADATVAEYVARISDPENDDFPF